MKKILLLITITATLTNCVAPTGPNTQRGSVVGGLIGAAAGAVIGHQGGNALEGAAIGGAVGAGAGAVFGNSYERPSARRAYEQPSGYYNQGK
jgi:uncharacterized protein YcfJ